MIKLFNSKSNKIETFKPIIEGNVSLYVCGPTVYNHAHIGNARPIVIFDTLKRFLEAKGFKVKYVSNYTDVDDKIINKAIEESISEKEVADRYISAYEEIRSLLHATNPDVMPRVTETMDQIISFIQQLIDQGNAYEVDGDVYFAIDTIKGYGELSHQHLDQLQVGARIQENEMKRSPLDFTVWKKTDQGIKWDSPWSQGRPGWHTECVVMIHNIFNQTKIDIHGGGQDLKFPHHENENAQNCALHDDSLANFWMHNAMIDLDNQKMSKSLGNVVWAKDMIESLGSNVTRWLLVQNHYRQTLSITDEVIASAQIEVTKIESALKQAALKYQLQQNINFKASQEVDERFLEALSDDLNTPNGVMVVFEQVKQLNALQRQKDLDMNNLKLMIEQLLATSEVLGLVFDLTIDDEDLAMVKAWNKAKIDKQFELADQLRQQLINKGILS